MEKETIATLVSELNTEARDRGRTGTATAQEWHALLAQPSSSSRFRKGGYAIGMGTGLRLAPVLEAVCRGADATGKRLLTFTGLDEVVCRSRDRQLYHAQLYHAQPCLRLSLPGSWRPS